MIDNFNIGAWKSKMLTENKEEEVNELVSLGKLFDHPEYKQEVERLSLYIQDKNTLAVVKDILENVGDLALRIGYEEASGDQSYLKVAESK